LLVPDWCQIIPPDAAGRVRHPVVSDAG
jgi:hypothetical protein